MREALLLATVLVIATCGLVYELLAGTLASYTLGDSVTQFSTVIGVYLSAMGIGSWLSGKVDRHVGRIFVDVELAVALVGGFSAPLLFLSFAHLSFFRVVLYGMVMLVGALVGLEIPLLLRILKDRWEFKDLVARVLSIDYLGALAASLLFPIFLVPKLGLVRTSVAVGLLNAAVGLWSTWLLGEALPKPNRARVRAGIVIVLLLAGFVSSDALTSLSEDSLYADNIVFAKQTKYQRIVVTRGRGSFQLFLNGNLQFSSADEYRYHEALVHPPLALTQKARHVLVLGGGDGLAVRELLKYPDVERITLVDLDPEMTALGRTNPLVKELNGDSFADPRVEIVNDDAYVWLGERRGPFDAAIVDFPDPNNFSLGKLYTKRFYGLLKASLAPGAPVSVQSTSPLMARASFWCVVRTMEDAGFFTRPYRATVPSFGEWGYVLASTTPFEVPQRPRLDGLRYVGGNMMPTLFELPPDMGPVPVEVNKLNNQALVNYYEAEWKAWN